MTRETSGVIVVDKPAGITSAGVVARLKRALKARKVGHAGTLDPFATGVLVCCINRATRLSRFFLAGTKTYRSTLCLGIETDTQDLTGAVTGTADPGNLTEAQIRSVIREFEGESEQLPPVYSALKHEGTPLYKLARKGRPVQKGPRKIRIERIEVQSVELPDVRFDVSCSAGTYIRTLCADIGRRLGCGGHLKALRRIEGSGFHIREAIPLDEVGRLSGAGELAARILPMAEALRGMPGITAAEDTLREIRTGRTILTRDLPPPDGVIQGFVKVVDARGRLMCVLEIKEGSDRYTYCGVFANE